jgi:hypothetical protein
VTARCTTQTQFSTEVPSISETRSACDLYLTRVPTLDFGCCLSSSSWEYCFGLHAAGTPRRLTRPRPVISTALYLRLWDSSQFTKVNSCYPMPFYALLIMGERKRVWRQNEHRFGRQSSLARPVRNRARTGLGEEHELQEKTTEGKAARVGETEI